MGHLAGDLTLREPGRPPPVGDLQGRSAGPLRRRGIRGGPDRSGPGHGSRLADQLRRTVEDSPFIFEGREYEVTISLGVASIQGNDVVSPLELIQRADEWLYQAKRDGRDCVVA